MSDVIAAARERVEGAIPEGRKAYIKVSRSLRQMSALTIEDQVFVAREAIESAVEADINQDFEPPLSPELSGALISLLATTDKWSWNEYRDAFSPMDFVVDPEAISAAELLLEAIEDHGRMRHLTTAERLYGQAYGGVSGE